MSEIMDETKEVIRKVRSPRSGAEGGEDDERCDPALIFFTLQGISEWHSEGKLPH